MNNSSKDEHKFIVKKFVLRQLKLYLFWFILLLPATLYLRREWFSSGILIGIYNFIKYLLFSSTFPASWFFSALIWGTLIVYLLSQKINYKFLFVAFLIINYATYLLVKNYNSLIEINFLKNIFNLYLISFPSPEFGFPISLIWILIGKMFADETIKHEIVYTKSKVLYMIAFVLFYYITKMDILFFFSPLLLIFVFQFTLKANISLKNAKILREISTITYPLHASVAPIFLRICKVITTNNILVGIISFFTTLLFCYIVCFIILKLEKKPQFKILKYSH